MLRGLQRQPVVYVKPIHPNNCSCPLYYLVHIIQSYKKLFLFEGRMMNQSLAAI